MGQPPSFYLESRNPWFSGFGQTMTSIYHAPPKSHPLNGSFLVLDFCAPFLSTAIFRIFAGKKIAFAAFLEGGLGETFFGAEAPGKSSSG
ncbi:MAG: hypothetical protein IJP78_06800 [Clostridia bacterium]|nr:hypothetical protein [Clostridia bacterium]